MPNSRGSRGLSSLAFLAALALGACTTRPEPKHWTEPSTGMEFVFLPAGSFTMGTPATEYLREAQEVPHHVTLNRGFYIGRFEVTEEQWQRVMGFSPNPSSSCEGRCPVETVNFLQVETFLSRLEAASGHRFRLPTEAEWEYACRAGTTTAFSFGTTLYPHQASFDGSDPYAGATPGEAPRSKSPVGSFAPNAWGLYDMHGSLWEWTQDDHCPYPAAEVTDPVGVCDSELKVIRGGSWLYGADSARCGLRYTHRPEDDGPSLGFRVVRDLP